MNVFDDGACASAKAVLAYMSSKEGVESSYKAGSGYSALPKFHRWHNGREQGYLVTMRSGDFKRQINIAFFEHRNSDEICAIEWEQVTMNPPTIDTAKFGDIYKDKYDVSRRFKYDQAYQMAEWVFGRLELFWELSKAKGE